MNTIVLEKINDTKSLHDKVLIQTYLADFRWLVMMATELEKRYCQRECAVLTGEEGTFKTTSELIALEQAFYRTFFQLFKSDVAVKRDFRGTVEAVCQSVKAARQGWPQITPTSMLFH